MIYPTTTGGVPDARGRVGHDRVRGLPGDPVRAGCARPGAAGPFSHTRARLRSSYNFLSTKKLLIEDDAASRMEGGHDLVTLPPSRRHVPQGGDEAE